MDLEVQTIFSFHIRKYLLSYKFLGLNINVGDNLKDVKKKLRVDHYE